MGMRALKDGGLFVFICEVLKFIMMYLHLARLLIFLWDCLQDGRLIELSRSFGKREMINDTNYRAADRAAITGATVDA